MGLKEIVLTKSIYVFHVSSGSCNNCDIEIIAALTPRFDLERFGVVLVGSIKHADAMLCTGSSNRLAIPRVKALYEQMPKPGFVIAYGSCGASRGLFKDSYNTCAPLDEIIPVDAYIPGCPPKPEATIAALAKLIARVRAKKAVK
ncbi:MAG: NADH-quinone oxidoreductase subunit NuoB [Candidatus Omnitrophica bacterium]|nr:NADH-quinone oxidoreductase subunit NuoB [Candidatus Omnitrophota bacterium]